MLFLISRINLNTGGVFVLEIIIFKVPIQIKKTLKSVMRLQDQAFKNNKK